MTKRHIRYAAGVLLSALLLVISSLLLPGCRRASDNGEIDGFWQINTVEKLSTGEVFHPEDRYIAVSLEIIQLMCTELEPYANYECTGHIIMGKDKRSFTADFSMLPKNKWPDRKRIMEDCGFYNLITQFDIECADCKRLVIRSSEAVITCTRW